MASAIQSMSLMALCLAIASVSLYAAVNAANIEHIKSLPELFDTAKQLESARLQVTESRKAYADKRARMVYAFVRESKGAHCERYNGQLKKTMDEYRVKAYNYIEDAKKPANWFTGFQKMLGGPLGSMKNLAKFDAYLSQVTERYEHQAPTGILTDADVDCDLAKLHVRALDMMMFVLQVDVKYLILESPQVVNIAIYRQLAEDKFVASSNFYDNEQVSPAQRRLLLEFYAARVDQDKTSVGQAVGHYYQPGNLIIGRLLESCHSLNEMSHTWAQVEPSRLEICKRSKSDMNNEQFSKEHLLSAYTATVDFCNKFLDAL